MNWFRKVTWMVVFIGLTALAGSRAQQSNIVLLDIDNLYIRPEISTFNDQVTVVTEVTTRSNGVHLGYEIKRDENVFIIEDCFFVGMLTVINHFKVTIPLGYLWPLA